MVIWVYLTKWLEAFAVENQNTLTVADCLVNEIIVDLVYLNKFTPILIVNLNPTYLRQFTIN